MRLGLLRFNPRSVDGDRISPASCARPEGRGHASHRREQGWALLGLVLALAVMGIVLASGVIPNVRFQVQRDKEIELLYRGEQMAEAIARYYGGGRLVELQLTVPPPYGYLTNLDRLRDGITVGIQEFKLVRPSAMIEPMISSEWEPVRARDPRIMKVLQAYSADQLVPFPQGYYIIAAAPVKTYQLRPLSPQPVITEPQPQPPATDRPAQDPKPEGSEGEEDADEEDEDEEDQDPEQRQPAQGAEELEDGADPLAHLFESGFGNLPIVGVAPRIKGASVRNLYGIKNYEDWVFIYIPRVIIQPGPRPATGRGAARPRTSQ